MYRLLSTNTHEQEKVVGAVFWLRTMYEYVRTRTYVRETRLHKISQNNHVGQPTCYLETKVDSQTKTKQIRWLDFTLDGRNYEKLTKV